MAQPSLIQVLLFVATGYDYTGSWKFDKPASYESKYTAEQVDEALKCYHDKRIDLSFQAAISSTAVKLVFMNGAEVTDSEIYDGENVKGWYAAYNIQGKKKIDIILADINLYAALQPQKDIETLAIAPTLEELAHQLGPEYQRFEQ